MALSKEQLIMVEIGYYYYNISTGKDEHEQIDNAQVSICRLGLVDVEFNEDFQTITLTLTSPGLLFGTAGINFKNLCAHLKEHLDFKFEKVNVKEKFLSPYLLNFRIAYDDRMKTMYDFGS